jgi:hypothetical protein
LSDLNVFELSTGPLTGIANQADGSVFDDSIALKDHSGIFITLAPGTYNVASAAAVIPTSSALHCPSTWSSTISSAA